MRLLNRRVALTVARFEPDSFFTLESNAVIIRDLRVAFDIRRNLESQPNTATIVVSNLAERTRAAFQSRPLNVTLEVGYDDDDVRIFTGDIIHTSSRKLSTDWETKMELGDGTRAHKHARVSRSFRSGVSVKDALRDTAASMGLRVPKSAADAQELLTTFATGLTLEGPSQKELTRLLAPRGFKWSIQDSKLQILRDTDVRTDEAVLIIADTGMIGSPESGAPKNPGDVPILTVSTLIDPRLVPGVRMRVESRNISGLYRVEQVRHVGDTHGDDWTTRVEAKPVI